MHARPRPASAQGRHRGSTTAAPRLKSFLGPPDTHTLTVWVVFLTSISATGSHSVFSRIYSPALHGALHQTYQISRSCRSTKPHPISTRWKIFRHSAEGLCGDFRRDLHVWTSLTLQQFVSENTSHNRQDYPKHPVVISLGDKFSGVLSQLCMRV